MKTKICVLVALIICCVVNVASQRKMSEDTGETLRLNGGKPTIYLDFVKIGVCKRAASFTVLDENPCESSRTDIQVEKFDAVWLRLSNNTKWAIEVKNRKQPIIDTYRLQTKTVVTSVSDGAEVDTFYDVEAETGCDFHEEAPKGMPCKTRDAVAPKIENLGVFSTVFVPPGQSLIFAVKREHLNKYLQIYVPYSYEWDIGFEEPKHRVYFSWFKLEKALKQNTVKPNTK